MTVPLNVLPVLPVLPVATMRCGWTAPVYAGRDREGKPRIETPNSSSWLWNEDGTWRNGYNGPHSLGREDDMDIVRITLGDDILFEI